MRKYIGVVLAAGMLVAGCGGSPAPEASPPVVAATVAVTTTVKVTETVTASVSESTTAASPPIESAPVPSSTAVSSSATSESGPLAGVVGEASPFMWSADNSGTITIHSLKWDKSGKDYASKPKGSYLVADVTFEGVTGAVSANPLWLVALDSDGRAVDGLIGDAGYRPQISAADLTPGRKARGFVSFDLDSKAVYSLELQDPVGKPLVSWMVPRPSL